MSHNVVEESNQNQLVRFRGGKIGYISRKYGFSNCRKQNETKKLLSEDPNRLDNILSTFIKNSKTCDIYDNYEKNLKIAFSILNLENDLSLAQVKLSILLNLNLRDCQIDILPSYFGDIFQNVKKLNLERNKISTIPNSFKHLKYLSVLNLSFNRLRCVHQICRLRRIHELRLTNNVITILPEKISEMTDLRILELDSNKIEYLPINIQNLWRLEIFSASCNNIRVIEDGISKLSRLRRLNLVGNLIRLFPSKFGELKLEVGKFSRNKIEYLHEDIFSPNLGSTLVEFWLDNNNILELPESITKLQKICIMTFDLNPLRSPPLSLLNEGLDAIMSYQLVRNERLSSLYTTLTKRGFSTSRCRFSPFARDVLYGNVGYLTPDDLSQFDDMFDRLLNSDFYLYQGTVEKCVDIVNNLYLQRLNEMHERMLNLLLEALWQNKLFPSHKCLQISRRRGKKNEKVSCFAIPLEIVFGENNQNQQQTCNLFQYVKENMLDADDIFNFNQDDMMDALKFASPYGQVASIEKVSYTKSSTGGIITLDSIVIVKTIYTSEEVERRKEEDFTLRQYFLKLEQSIEQWSKRRNGARSINAEVSHRLKCLKQNLKYAKVSFKDLNAKDLFLAESTLNIAKQRSHDYRAKKSIECHFIENDAQAEAIINEAKTNLIKIKKEISSKGKEIESLKSLLEQKDRKEMFRNAMNDIRIKYCFHIFEQVMIIKYDMHVLLFVTIPIDYFVLNTFILIIVSNLILI